MMIIFVVLAFIVQVMILRWIFKVGVPKSVFVRDTGINYSRLTNKINNPDKFTIKDILILAQLINIDSRKLYDLIAIVLLKGVVVKSKS